MFRKPLRRSVVYPQNVRDAVPRIRVLLVEDEALIRGVVLDALVDEGFEVVAAETGEQAVERCWQGPVDVLVTDIRLPGEITGWKVAEMCRQANPRLPVIHATGSSGSQPRPVAGTVLLRKPYRPEEIVGAIWTLTSL